MGKMFFDARIWIGYDIEDYEYFDKIRSKILYYSTGVIIVDNGKIEGIFTFDYLRGNIGEHSMNFELFIEDPQKGSITGTKFSDEFDEPIEFPESYCLTCNEDILSGHQLSCLFEVDTKITTFAKQQLYEKKILDLRKVYSNI